ncbi:DUF485 domain-containing protein [Leptospira wolffii]|uniref:DUF485 domain-containing protein n=1 Tax=Leptospira wolffii TaxID=409998 RepID=UPI0010824785|nr:DUF485 domain-containing protein [Leptospira wolffii]TGK62646.1 DUF485 domain-containing protein [Leptospira wolffii]TGK65621.1 DUF485 domain-containing protein [Leptospira wolffii]TGK73967.1 DUF485 domain-containing protein [Leptospira wolffii]TGL28828.1 DUF485 domain-containing protein [Leptospira wolffii]
MKLKAHQLIELPEFKKLVRTRWTFSFILLFLLFANYYGFILVIALDKESVTKRVGEFSNYGLFGGTFVILISWVLTITYVIWANRFYDREVNSLKEKLETEGDK